MILLSMVAALAVLWVITFTNPAGTDFLRVTAFNIPDHPIKGLDVLIGLVILGIGAAMSGPLRATAGALFVLWLLTLMGVPRVAGVPLQPVIVMIIVVGGAVHAVTYKVR